MSIFTWARAPIRLTTSTGPASSRLAILVSPVKCTGRKGWRTSISPWGVSSTRPLPETRTWTRS